MVFSSITFLFLFLPFCIGLYYIFHKNCVLKNAWLLACSIFFYAWGEPSFVFVMILSICLNWFFGLAISKNMEHSSMKAFFIIAMLFTNIGIIFHWKYAAFFINTVNSICKTSFNIPEIVLPIGISFFTLQAISYVLDIATKDIPPLKSIFDVALYISFFPQLIAGPIVRYETISKQIYNRIETSEDFVFGFSRLCRGLFKKIMIANTMAEIADAVFNSNPISLDCGAAWLGVIGYAFQIYYDFSGYSDMALGMSRMFGFHFLENFDHPYTSRSVSEFWRRWHISLGTWFRDYVYYPMGGSKVEKSTRMVFNLFVVWLLTGIWHGARWTFIFWGLFFFLVISLEKLFSYEKKVVPTIGIIAIIPTFLLVLFGWVIFRSPSMEYVVIYYKIMLGLSRFDQVSFPTLFTLMNNIVTLAIAVILSFPFTGRLFDNILKKGKVWRMGIVMSSMGLFLISVSRMVKGSFNPFIYFNF